MNPITAPHARTSTTPIPLSPGAWAAARRAYRTGDRATVEAIAAAHGLTYDALATAIAEQELRGRR